MKTEKNIVADTEVQGQTLDESGLAAGVADDQSEERDVVAMKQTIIKSRLADTGDSKEKPRELARKAASGATN